MSLDLVKRDAAVSLFLLSLSIVIFLARKVVLV